jgi:uncharacterized protein (TIGR04255 family)
MANEICYNNSFLKEVIFRVDFPTPLNNLTESVSKDLSKAILRSFPIFEPHTVHAQDVQINHDGVTTSSEEIKTWIYHGAEREKSLVLDYQSVTMSIKRYNSYEAAFSEYKLILEAIFQENKDLFSSRIGVRYINSIDLDKGNPLEWNEYIDESILGVFSFHSTKNISRAFHILEFNFDGQSLKCQFGIPNPDYPAVIKRKQFVLDLDSYFTGVFELNDICDSIESCHQKIQEFFEKSITDETRRLMRGEE